MTDRRWDKKRKLLRMQRLAIRTIPEDKLNAAFTPRAAKALADYSIALEAQIEKLRQERDQALAQLDEVREELQAERQKHSACYEALDWTTLL
jgi:hypothetical protein